MTTIRQRVDCLSDARADQLREAYRRLMNSTDPRGNYAFWADIHRRCCPHRSELFLPWHRAYIFMFERALQEAVADDSLGLPYWNWTVGEDIPDLFTKEPMTADRDPRRDPARLPTRDSVAGLLGLPTFGDFGGRRCEPKCASGDLEDLHGHIHVWVGPTMASVKTAPKDPIFWSHHCFVDALWLAWQHTHSENPRCPDATLQGIPGDWTVKDTLDTRSARMDYEVVACARTVRLTDWNTGAASPAYPLLVPPRTSRFRITLDLVTHGEGVMPIGVRVRGAGASTFDGAISLFGLHGDHAAHEPGGPAGLECGHVKGSPSRSFEIDGDTASVFRELSLQLEFEWPRADSARVAVEANEMEILFFDDVLSGVRPGSKTRSQR